MDREVIARSVENGIRHIVYNDPAGTRFLNGRIVYCGESSTVVQDMDGEEFSIQNHLIERIEPYRPTGRRPG